MRARWGGVVWRKFLSQKNLGRTGLVGDSGPATWFCWLGREIRRPARFPGDGPVGPRVVTAVEKMGRPPTDPQFGSGGTGPFGPQMSESRSRPGVGELRWAGRV